MMTDSQNDIQTAEALGGMSALSLRLLKLQGPIEALLRLAVRLLPRGRDYSMVYCESQTHYNRAWWPVDMWMQTGPLGRTLIAKVGQWEMMLDFHKDSRKVRTAKELARVQAQDEMLREMGVV